MASDLKLYLAIDEYFLGVSIRGFHLIEADFLGDHLLLGLLLAIAAHKLDPWDSVPSAGDPTEGLVDTSDALVSLPAVVISKLGTSLVVVWAKVVTQSFIEVVLAVEQ